MTAKYQAYSEYKDSGVEWLGVLPQHWEWIRLKYVAELEGEKIDPGSRHQYVGMENIESGNGKYLVKEDTTPEGLSTSFLEGDVLFGKLRPYLAKSWLANFSGICSSEFLVLRSRKVNAKFLNYYTLTEEFINQVESSTYGSKMPRASWDFISLMGVPIPEYDNSKKIANFLDHETAKIDTLIEKQQQLIKLLKEKRQAVISHAVTKGLNPNAPMCDSGVEWLGDVPEHWEVKKISYVINAIGDVDHYMPQSIEKGIPYVMTGDLKGLASSINFEDCKQVSHKDYLKLSSKIKSSKGDVIMARYATIGTASYIDIDADFLVSYSCVTIKPNLSKAFGLYLFYYFKSAAFLQGIKNQINTNTQENVGVNDLKKVKVALPTLDEQSRIIEYLQSKISKINSISDRSQTAINLMQERRTALISAAVTGKIDLRNWQSPNKEKREASV